MSSNFEIFKGTSFSDLMKDIYHNSKKKERQINTLIQELQPMIKNVGDATVIVPLIKEYLDVAVKNDDALVKLASVVQRLVQSESKATGETEFGLSDDERKQLLEVAEQQLIDIQTDMEINDADRPSN
jgi:hypothetical protein|tara:strand:- start:51 stop:434 length:384 start_codon:yes stop_codon:yes gene_type:complete